MEVKNSKRGVEYFEAIVGRCSQPDEKLPIQCHWIYSESFLKTKCLSKFYIS